jgi:hypothetical protein
VGFVREAVPVEANTTESRETWTRLARIVVDEELLEGTAKAFDLEYHSTSTALDDVVRILLPLERQREISQLIATEWQANRDELTARIQPLVENTLQIAVREIELALPAAVQRRRAEFGKLADRYQAEIVRGRVIPLVQEEILPIIEEEIRPLANELGRDLWNRVSVWAFTWRFLYDVSPLPERNAVQKEFDRFLIEEVRPAMEARSQEFVTVTERALTRISNNERVRDVITTSLRTVASDSELHAIIWSIVQESVVVNEPLRRALRDYWSSADVQQTLQLASTRFEPTARKIGDMILGSREGGVTPEFARVLRTQILLKDRRWLVVTNRRRPDGASLGTSNQIQIVMPTTPMDFPISFRSKEQSPLTRFQPEPPAE